MTISLVISLTPHRADVSVNDSIIAILGTIRDYAIVRKEGPTLFLKRPPKYKLSTRRQKQIYKLSAVYTKLTENNTTELTITYRGLNHPPKTIPADVTTYYSEDNT